MQLKNIRLETRTNRIYAELRDTDGSLIINACLDYILAQIAKRGYQVEGVAENPTFTRRLA